ncbi:hypothetical protein, partial [Acidocella sp.]|uniref:beta strand repeat-containing protein n=1 Tax=Acidocella sp. TaxID=50710 RepID=UPI00261CB719
MEQVDGVGITLTNGANLTLLGIAAGIFYGNADTLTPSYGTLSGLHGAQTVTPQYDKHMSILAVGSDTLTVETIDDNFGKIAVGTGSTLTIDNIVAGNAQSLHGLVNYGLISISSGGKLIISDATYTAKTGTLANFFNAGWIVDNGGTLDATGTLLDGTNTANSAGTIDGYVIVENGAQATLSNSVASHELISFSGTGNTLAITAGTLFQGTVAGFGSTDTIAVNGFTSTSNITLTTVDGTPELITTNGSVLTTITLAGSVSSMIVAGTNSAGQEYIQSGNNAITGGTSTLGGAGSTVTTSGGMTVSGAGTTLSTYDSLAGNGTITIQNGATFGLYNTAGSDGGVTVEFGTLGGATSPNTLIVNDNAAGFAGTITGFGGGDRIDVGASVLPSLTSGEGLAYSYSGGVLTVSETKNAGGTVAATALTIAGSGLSTASFVALESNSGVEIELAPTVATGFTFTGNGSFEAPANYAGGVAPGDVLSGLESVTIAANTASVSSGGVTDNGTISVAAGAVFVDGGSLSGTGALNVAGSATLSGATTLAAIADSGTLVLGGTDAAAVAVGAGAQVTLAANFADSQAITGPGTLTVNAGVTATLAAGTSLGSIIDHGTIVAAGSLGGPINMEGDGAKTAVAFATGNAAP